VNIIRVKYTALFLFPLVCAIVNAQTVIGGASTCTNANVVGSYGYTLSGWIFATAGSYPFADAGSLTFDGKENISGTSTYSLDGTIQPRTLTGTYSVNTNCTGTATVTDSLGNITHLNLTVVANGQSMQFVQTDSNTVISGSATAQQTGCTAEAISGMYGFASNGWVYDTSGNPYPFTDVGNLSSGGADSFTLNDTTSTAGTVAGRSVPGNYSLNSNCKGTATITVTGGTLHLSLIVVAGAIEFIETDAGTTISGSANVLTDIIAGGTLAHIASGGGWQTTFTLINPSTSSAQVQLNFYDNNGNALSLPLTYVQTNATSTASSVTQTIAAGASLVILAEGSSTAPVVEGSAQLTSGGSAGVNGYAIFRYNPTAQEAVVPLETRNPAAFVLGFDNTSGLATGVALSNVSGQAATVAVVLRDDIGTTLEETTISLSARGHTAFVLYPTYASTKNRRGTVEFDTPLGGQITALGILYTPTGAFTSIPVLVK
jgi:hypothetical protein